MAKTAFFEVTGILMIFMTPLHYERHHSPVSSVAVQSIYKEKTS